MATQKSDFEAPAAQTVGIALKAATGQLEGSAKMAGLIFDRNAIISIKRYEARGLALPSSKTDIEAILGITCDKKGLTPTDFLKIYDSVRSNAKSWSNLERGLLDTSINLDKFADEIDWKGKRISNCLEEICMKYMDNIEFTDTKQLTDKKKVTQLFENLDNKPLYHKEDALRVRTAAITTKQLIDEAEKYTAEAKDLQDKLHQFKDCLNENRGKVDRMERKCDRFVEQSELPELEAKRDQLKKDISMKSAEYDRNVGLAFTGAVGMVIPIIGWIPWIITGSIYGAKAEVARKRIKELQEELVKVKVQIAECNVLQKGITILGDDFEGLEVVMVHALKGVAQLIEVWGIITADLNKSSEAIKKVENTKDLMEYWLQALDIFHPWKDVKSHAGMLTVAIQDAIDSTLKDKHNDDVVGSDTVDAPGVNLKTLASAGMPPSLQQDLPVISCQTVKQVNNQIRDMYNSINESSFPDHFVYITDIYQASSDGVDHMTAGVIKVRENSKVPASVSNSNLMIKTFLLQLENETDQDKIDKLQQKILSFNEMGDSTINNILIVIDEVKGSLVNDIQAIKVTDFENKLVAGQDRKKNEITVVDKRIIHATAEWQKAKENRKKLEETLDILRQDNLFKKLGRIVPGTEDVKTAMEACPDKKMEDVLAGLNVIKNCLAVVGDLFNEMQLQKAINYHADLEETYETSMREGQKELQDLRYKTQDLETMEKVTQIRFDLIAELNNFVLFLDVYKNKLEEYMTSDNHFDQIIEVMNMANGLLIHA